MSLAVETRAVPLRIVGLDGRATEGELFLHTVAERTARPESVDDRLNGGIAFVPVRIGGRVELLNLDHVAYLAGAGELPEVGARLEVGARRERVEFDLAHGETLVGELVYTLPPGHARVSDLLNQPGERFLLLVAEAETLFVRRGSVVRARTG
ncbi:MAG TPA: hypothetical protein VI942_09960 [Thermoanaerobaculia bacterium]|nr:hypothetical protein [Thermoanaerobaculia bacterium]